MTTADSFRGIKGIRDIKAKLEDLVEWYVAFKPDVTELVCSRADYDLIARWPRAASFENFISSDNGIFYKGLRLTYDTGEGRYANQSAPEQAVIS